MQFRTRVWSAGRLFAIGACLVATYLLFAVTAMRVALRVRGYRNRPTLHSYRTIGHVTGTLLVRGYEQAERVEQAMRCRGYDGTFRTLHDFRTRPVDVFVFLAIVGCAVVLVIVDLIVIGR